GIFRKTLATLKIFSAARKFKRLAEIENATTFFTNTPRTHFVVFVAKKFLGLKGKWIAVFHDFTTRPDVLLKQICHSADILVANSMPTRKYLRERIAEPDTKKIRLIENGVEFNDNIPTPNPPKKLENLLILGRFDPQKGQLFAVKTAEILKKHLPNLKFKITGSSVASDPRTTDYEEKTKFFVKSHNLNNITFSENVSNPFSEILKHDAVLILSTTPETFGRVVIETLACGKFIIAFDQTGPREILENFEKFVLKQTGKQEVPTLRCDINEHSLAEKIKFFVKNFNQTIPFTQNARKFVETNFDFRETKKGLLNVIEG
ncbi:MAG: glycosyltransferase family 4 protein, partial [Candidatus Peregrinibacteria bacterium]|nr:glycosyltransferase family 4 protein [Candidatus Peregrinibacteria bacterium]